MDIRLSRCARADCPTCCAPRILKAADRAVRLVDRERAELAAKKHDARGCWREKQRNIDPAILLVQKTR